MVSPGDLFGVMQYSRLADLLMGALGYVFPIH